MDVQRLFPFPMEKVSLPLAEEVLSVRALAKRLVRDRLASQREGSRLRPGEHIDPRFLSKQVEELVPLIMRRLVGGVPGTSKTLVDVDPTGGVSNRELRSVVEEIVGEIEKRIRKPSRVLGDPLEGLGPAWGITDPLDMQQVQRGLRSPVAVLPPGVRELRGKNLRPVSGSVRGIWTNLVEEKRPTGRQLGSDDVQRLQWTTGSGRLNDVIDALVAESLPEMQRLLAGKRLKSGQYGPVLDDLNLLHRRLVEPHLYFGPNAHTVPAVEGPGAKVPWKIGKKKEGGRFLEVVRDVPAEEMVYMDGKPVPRGEVRARLIDRFMERAERVPSQSIKSTTESMLRKMGVKKMEDLPEEMRKELRKKIRKVAGGAELERMLGAVAKDWTDGFMAASTGYSVDRLVGEPEPTEGYVGSEGSRVTQRDALQRGGPAMTRKSAQQVRNKLGSLYGFFLRESKEYADLPEARKMLQRALDVLEKGGPLDLAMMYGEAAYNEKNVARAIEKGAPFEKVRSLDKSARYHMALIRKADPALEESFGVKRRRREKELLMSKFREKALMRRGKNLNSPRDPRKMRLSTNRTDNLVEWPKRPPKGEMSEATYWRMVDRENVRNRRVRPPTHMVAQEDVVKSGDMTLLGESKPKEREFRPYVSEGYRTSQSPGMLKRKDMYDRMKGVMGDEVLSFSDARDAEMDALMEELMVEEGDELAYPTRKYAGKTSPKYPIETKTERVKALELWKRIQGATATREFAADVLPTIFKNPSHLQRATEVEKAVVAEIERNLLMSKFREKALMGRGKSLKSMKALRRMGPGAVDDRVRLWWQGRADDLKDLAMGVLEEGGKRDTKIRDLMKWISKGAYRLL